MEKFLIYFNKSESIDHRVLEPTNYKFLWSENRHKMVNSGNKLWLQPIIQYLIKPNIEYDYLDNNLTYDKINSKYNMVVVPRANLFGKELFDKFGFINIQFAVSE
ncbi:MAG: hypothetical protein LBL79_14755, partial [Prevotella sp.]|nr:hypothetical protein [Prevotella sp.]